MYRPKAQAMKACLHMILDCDFDVKCNFSFCKAIAETGHGHVQCMLQGALSKPHAIDDDFSWSLAGRECLCRLVANAYACGSFAASTSFVRVVTKVVEGRGHMRRHLALAFLSATCTSLSVVAG